MYVKFQYHNYKTVNVIDKNIIPSFVNKILGKINSQQINDFTISTFQGLILKISLLNYKLRDTLSYFQRHWSNFKLNPYAWGQIKLISGINLKIYK